MGKKTFGQSVAVAAAVVFGLMAVALAVLPSPVQCQTLDTSNYEPGPEVRRWRSSFNLTLDSNTDMAIEYVMDVAKARVIPFVAIGLILFLVIFIWSCCRCCGKCHLDADKSSFVCKILIACLTITVIASIALAAVGLQAGKKQDEAFTNFPTILDSVTSFVDDVGDNSDAVLVVTGLLLGDAQDLRDADPMNLFISAQDIQDFEDSVTAIETQVNSINGDVGDIDLSTLGDVSTQTEDINGTRNQIFTAVLGVLLGLVLIEALIAYLDVLLTEDRPSDFCGILVGIISIITALVVLILWILGGALILAMTGVADICYDPNTQVLNLVASDSASTNDIITYYLTCGVDTDQDSPFVSEINDLQVAYNESQAQVEGFINDVPDNCGIQQPTCDNIETILLNIQDHLTNLSTTAGLDTVDSQGNADSGFLELVACASLNGRYNNALNVVCGDGAEALGQSTNVVIGFAIVFLLMQFLTRFVSDIGGEFDSKIT